MHFYIGCLSLYVNLSNGLYLSLSADELHVALNHYIPKKHLLVM